MTNMRVEKWNGRKVYVVREFKGRLVTWKNVKGSGLSQSAARNMFRTYGTFSDKYYFKREKFRTGVIQSTKLYKKQEDVPRKPRFPEKRYISKQYSVGTYDVGGRNGIWARSDKIKGDSTKNIEKARRVAEKRFYCLLDMHYTGRYDEDEGMEISKQNNIHILQGYVWYTKPYRNRRKSARRR